MRRVGASRAALFSAALRPCVCAALLSCVSAPVFAQAPNNTSITVSANPVTVAPVIVHWPPVAGTATVQVFTLTGLAVVNATSATARWQWDPTNAGGPAVANGTYPLVVTLPGNTRLRARP